MSWSRSAASLLVEDGDFGAALIGQLLLPGQRRLCLVQRQLQLLKADVALLDLALGQGGAFPLGAELAFKLLRAVADGGEFRHQGFALLSRQAQFLGSLRAGGLGLLELFGGLVALGLRPLGQSGQGGDLGFKLLADIAERLDIGLQAGDLAERGLDLLAVGFDHLIGVFQLPADLGDFAGGLIAATRQGRDLGVELILFGLRFGEAGGKLLPVGGRALQFGGKLGDVDAKVGVRLPLHGEQVAQFRQLPVQARQGLIAARQRVGHVELRDDEDHQHEDHDHDQRGQGIDPARPDIDRVFPAAPPAAAACHNRLSDPDPPRHRSLSSARAAMVRASSLISLRIS